ncbi:MAG: DEAD/DEAH box helicase family protein [Anaerolineae bacterium]|nr:DEAD/DEAH box helicase family protein [Anaerolineae bacterium]
MTTSNNPSSPIRRFSSRRQRLDRTFLAPRLKGAKKYDRIAGYFSSSLLELVGEEVESVQGQIRIVCNSELHPHDVKTAKAAQMAVRRAWTTAHPEKLLQGPGSDLARDRFRRLYTLLSSGKLQVRVLPDEAFGLIHGKAGIITLADTSQICFVGSANESKSAWRLNYELLWEDNSPEAVAWVQEEFDALWGSSFAVPLAEAVVQDILWLSKRRVIHSIDDWLTETDPNPAAAIIETPVYREEVGLWEHQKYFVKLVFEAHRGPMGQARYILADQVGLGKTLQLAMSAQLIALTGSRPVLIICPKTLLWQWQTEMRDLLAVPSAVWDGRRWVDEQGYTYPAIGSDGILKSPRRIGIVSSGLISRRSETAENLLKFKYDCVILDEAHRARRRNLGKNREHEPPEPNNLLRFMYDIAERTRSLLLATATPMQLRPIEAWDLLDILSRNNESVLGNRFSRWRHGAEALALVMEQEELPANSNTQWEWLRNPFPPRSEHIDFDILRRNLNIPDDQAVLPGNILSELSPPDRQRLHDLFPRLMIDYNPFIRHIVRRTRRQLENEIDPETKMPLLQRIDVELFGEGTQDAIPLPTYLQQAYALAEEFCKTLEQGSGFMETLLLRRVGSSIHAGLMTARNLLGDWAEVEAEEEDDPIEVDEVKAVPSHFSRSLNESQRTLLERFITALDANRERDPKYEVVLDCLQKRGWLERGCIIFSQYRDSIQWLAEQLTQKFPEEPIALYSGPTTSGIMHNGQWQPTTRESLKLMVRRDELRLMLGTDAASEGLNLQRLGTLINLDLPWNPTRLEQRKGRIQRIGQKYDTVFIYNMRYQGSVEDRVHELLSSRLQAIYNLFGQIPDILEDAWVALALGEQEQAKKLIDELPEQHVFEMKYSNVEKVEWETYEKVLDAAEKWRILGEAWS